MENKEYQNKENTQEDYVNDVLKLWAPGYEYYMSHQLGRLREKASSISTLGTMTVINGAKGAAYSTAFHIPNFVMEQCLGMYDLSPEFKLSLTGAIIAGNIAIGSSSYVAGAIRGAKKMTKELKKHVTSFFEHYPEKEETDLESVVENKTPAEA